MNKYVVMIESPYRGNFLRRLLNRHYARRCLRDSIDRGEAPFASHLLYTQVLNDQDDNERKLGIECGLEFQNIADIVAVYTDKGISSGMKLAIERAISQKITVEYRSLNKKNDLAF